MVKSLFLKHFIHWKAWSVSGLLVLCVLLIVSPVNAQSAHDVLNRLIRLENEINTLTNEEKTPGKHSIEFDGSNLSSGIYFYRLQTDDYSETKKMFLIRK